MPFYFFLVDGESLFSALSASEDSQDSQGNWKQNSLITLIFNLRIYSQELEKKSFFSCFHCGRSLASLSGQFFKIPIYYKIQQSWSNLSKFVVQNGFYE